MKKLDDSTNLFVPQAHKQGKLVLPGYPLYPAGEDIFRNTKKKKTLIQRIFQKQKN